VKVLEIITSTIEVHHKGYPFRGSGEAERLKLDIPLRVIILCLMRRLFI